MTLHPSPQSAGSELLSTTRVLQDPAPHVHQKFPRPDIGLTSSSHILGTSVLRLAFPISLTLSPDRRKSFLQASSPCMRWGRGRSVGLTVIKIYFRFLSRIKDVHTPVHTPILLVHPDISSSESGVVFVLGVKREQCWTQSLSPDCKT